MEVEKLRHTGPGRVCRGVAAAVLAPLLAGVAATMGQAVAHAQGHTAGPTHQCVLWDKAPDSPDTAPQLDLLEGRMAVSGDGRTLLARLVVADLQPTVPPGSTNAYWLVLWTYAGQDLYAMAEVSLTGADVQYTDGVVTRTSTGHTLTRKHSDNGSMTVGKNGVVEVDVPLANLGRVQRGAMFTAPYGQTVSADEVDNTLSNPVANSGGISVSLTDDTTATGVTYVIGGPCGKAAGHDRPAPTTPSQATAVLAPARGPLHRVIDRRF